ncbi:MAG: hypothetical protein KGS60_17765 [Verrucomicrobia bacterium]|nr:hypothetical protein [Verrucomicrobiota bacterium]
MKQNLRNIGFGRALAVWSAAFIMATCGVHAQSAVVIRHLRTFTGAGLGAFLQSFPYDGYLRQVNFTDFDTVQEDRLFVWRKFGDGDAFLYHLGEKFLEFYPVQGEPGGWAGKIAIGESYLNARGRGVHGRNEEPYHTIGYYILGRVAARMTDEIAKGKVNPDAPEVQALMQRLAASKVHVAFERGFLSKLVFNVQNGNWDYIRDRVNNQVQGVVQKAQALAGGGQGGPGAPATATLAMRRLGEFGASPDGYRMSAFHLDDPQGAAMGQVVLVRRPGATADYLADDVVRRFRAKPRPMIAMTGGFTNNYQKAEGLTIDHGSLVNAVIMHDRDGLVLVERGGGIRVLNLDRPTIKLPDLSGMLEIENPRGSLVAFSELLDWAGRTRATVFQTQLLAYSDALLIDPAKASGTVAERRLLGLTTDRKSGAVTHVIFNVRRPHALADISAKAFGLLQSRGLKVEALLNLDTGGQDVMEVYDEKGQVLAGITGRLPISQTTNLVVYSY